VKKQVPLVGSTKKKRKGQAAGVGMRAAGLGIASVGGLVKRDGVSVT
jgi:hypothetical protein